tara:strand:+ start:1900 stop:2682 length:783 start_codon:yes stop_codon:yes gene_type:complete
MADITIVITSSKIRSHPKITCIKGVLNSIDKFVLSKNKPKIIITQDFDDNPLYLSYLQNLEKYISNKPHMQIVKLTKRGYLIGNVLNALKYVKTKYVLIVQHDLPFITNIYLDKILLDLENNPSIKCMRFGKKKVGKQNCDSWGNNSLYGKEITGKYFTYTRTAAFCDNNHICKKDYYYDFVLKHIKLPTPENACLKDKRKIGGMETQLKDWCNSLARHNEQGTYVFGKHNITPAQIGNIDGRKSTHEKLISLLNHYKLL